MRLPSAPSWQQQVGLFGPLEVPYVDQRSVRSGMSLSWIVMALAAPGLLLGLAMLWAAWRTIGGLDDLSEVSVEKREAWPTLSLISPACDEEAKVEASLRSALDSHYPALEVVAIDDRSTDRTGEIIDKIAGVDDRVRAVHIEELPAGWLGKLNAMARGVEVASGAWLLFADADVVFSRHALQKAVTYAEANELDYLTLFPRIESTTLWTDIVFNAVGTLALPGARPWSVRDPKSAAILGGGAFILIRRVAYDAGPGLAWMRLEVADDQMLCGLIKRHGGTCDVVNGSGEVHLVWYSSLGEVASKMQKGFFGCVAQFSLLKGLAVSLLLAYIGLFPLLALVSGAGWAASVPVLGLLSMTVAALVVGDWVRGPWLPRLALGLGLLLLSAMVAWSSLVGWRQGGITWRGTFYSSELLDPHQRLGRGR
jgi:cellulose synthase/poly-beta-1,6-N-acetylglucosamine synthase-like glycosyltransferase